MKKSKFTDEQITFELQQGEVRPPCPDIAEMDFQAACLASALHERAGCLAGRLAASCFGSDASVFRVVQLGMASCIHVLVQCTKVVDR